ncbi:MAG: hypothetical protein MUE90_06275 [Thermoanaerobaculales bacterium]|nr:hypothetical protein [Thermoanaerobaculales bacterium]
MIRRSPILALLLLAAAAPFAAAPAPQLLIEAPPELAAVATELRALGGENFSEVLRLTGRPGFSRPIAVVLAPETSALARDTPAWVSGYARGDDALIVLFPARVRSYPDTTLRTLLHHEIAHVLVAGQAPGAALVQRGRGDRGGARVGPRGPGPLRRSSRGPRPREHPRARRGLRRNRRRGAAGLRPVRGLRALPAARARPADSRRAFASAERSFFEDEAFWSTWLPFLTSTGALWMAVTALALLAIHRRRVRSRRMLERWAAEEEPAGRVIRRQDPGGDGPVN